MSYSFNSNSISGGYNSTSLGLGTSIVSASVMFEPEPEPPIRKVKDWLARKKRPTNYILVSPVVSSYSSISSYSSSTASSPKKCSDSNKM
jgi:hypothetical protein